MRSLQRGKEVEKEKGALKVAHVRFDEKKVVLQMKEALARKPAFCSPERGKAGARRAQQEAGLLNRKQRRPAGMRRKSNRAGRTDPLWEVRGTNRERASTPQNRREKLK